MARRNRWEINGWFWTALATLIVLAGLVAWKRAKPKFLDRKAALIQLDARLGLNNALTTASKNRGPWPPSEHDSFIFRWRFEQLLVPLAIAAVLLLSGFLIPMAPANQADPANQPYTWSRLEAEVADLLEDEVIQEDYADEIKKRLEELRSQKAEEWFSAASLEATDSLQQAHRREANRLQKDLMKVEQAIRKATDPGATEEQRQQLQQQFQEALEGMRNGRMKPNPELLEKLTNAAGERLKNMPADQLEKLKNQLRDLADKLGEGEGEKPGEDEGEGEGIEGPGQGGVQRGPGIGEDLFGEKSPDLELKKFERLDDDSKEPDPGDLLKLEELEHDIDRSQKNPTASGEAQSKGLGGDRVWKDALDPDEQKALKEFFE